jgi:hypothetical protein
VHPRGDHFQFGLVFTYKINQTEIFYKKKPKPNGLSDGLVIDVNIV